MEFIYFMGVAASVLLKLFISRNLIDISLIRYAENKSYKMEMKLILLLVMIQNRNIPKSGGN